MPKAARGLSPSFPLRPSSATECPPPLSDEGLLQWFQRITMGVGTGPRREERHCADADGDHRFNDDEEPRSRQKHEEAAYDDDCRLSRETFRRWRRGAHCSLQVEDRTLRPNSRFDPCPRSCSFVPEICSSKPCQNGAHGAMLPISGQSNWSPSWRTSRKSRWPLPPSQVSRSLPREAKMVPMAEDTITGHLPIRSCRSHEDPNRPVRMVGSPLPDSHTQRF